MQYRGLLRCMRLSPHQSSPCCFSTFPHVRLRARSSQAQHSPRDMESANSACDRSLPPFAHSVPGPWIVHQVFGNRPAATLPRFGRGTMAMQELRKFCFAYVFGFVSWPYTSPLKMSNGSSWQKGRLGAGENYIWPVPEGTDQVSNNCANCLSNVTK
jgi:hypothetical protein